MINDIPCQYIPELNLYKILTPSGKYFINVDYDSHNLFYSKCPVLVLGYNRGNLSMNYYFKHVRCVSSYGGINIRRYMLKHHSGGRNDKVAIFLYQIMRNYELTIDRIEKIANENITIMQRMKI